MTSGGSLDRSVREQPSAGSGHLAVVVVLAVVVGVWGAAFSGIKVLLRSLGPEALTAGRLVIAAASYTVFLAVGPRRPLVQRRGDLGRLVLIGLAGSAGYHLAINWGEQYVSAGLASLLVASMPAMVAVGAVLVLGERLGPRAALGVAVAFGGVALLTVTSGEGLETRSVLGPLVTLLAPLSWTVYTLVAKPLAERYDGVRLNLLGAWVGALVVLPFAVGEIGSFARLDAEAWFWLVYLGTLSTAGAYVAYAWALRRWSASAVASFVYLVPAASLLWAWLLLDEVPSLWAIAGGVLVVGGVALVQRSR